MKKLSHFVVRVTNAHEFNVAVKFYQRASRRKLNRWMPTAWESGVVYVGMYSDRTVLASSRKFDYEQVVPFQQMDTLADTPARKVALIASGWKQNKPVKGRPVVTFDYPASSRNPVYPTAWKISRTVELISADDRYLTGLEVTDDKHQFKKFLKSRASNFQVVKF